MQQRSEPIGSADYFGTPPWATRALMERLKIPRSSTVWDPACGRGFMARPLTEYSRSVISSDLFDYGFGEVKDFLSSEADGIDCDWVITNPPFNLAADFILKALYRARFGVAVLVRTAFVESRGRYESLFRDHPPTLRLQFVDRVVMHKGDPPNPDISVQVWDKKKSAFVLRRPSTATSYEWMVWDKSSTSNATASEWLATKRSDLSKSGDYLA